MPFVGPGVEDCSGQTSAYYGIEVPSDHLRLFLLGVADGIHAEFAHDERLVLGEILESGEIAVEVLPAVQVDVEGQEVDVLGKKILGRRIARVGVECTGILAAGNVNEMLYKLGYALGTEPAYHGGGDFVAE